MSSPPNLYEIHVTLPENRTNVGELEVRDANGRRVAGPFPVLGLADPTEASARRNPDRASLLPYGNTPVGTYAIAAIVDSAAGTVLGECRSESGYLTYGREGVIVLRPIDGDAQRASDNGRTSLWIHSGDLNARGEIRPTNGCLRIPPGIMTALRSVIASMGRAGVICRAVGGAVAISGYPVAPRGEDIPSDPPPALLLPVLGGVMSGWCPCPDSTETQSPDTTATQPSGTTTHTSTTTETREGDGTESDTEIEYTEETEESEASEEDSGG